MKNAKVLVVDDENDFRELLREFLLTKGYEVFTADDGLKAIAAAKEKVPDVIILDVMLPEKNGIDVCREIKSDETLKGSGIILLTVKKELHDKLNGYMAGAQRYLTKPCSLDEIDSCLRTVLYQREIHSSQYDSESGSL